MTLGTVSSWLPQAAFLGSKGVLAIDRVLREWSAHWLAQETLAAVGGWTEAADPPPPSAMSIGPGLAFSFSDEDRLQLASLLLDREVRARNLRTAQDAAVIAQLVDEAVADLCARLNALLGKQEGATEARTFDLKAGVSGDHPLLALHISQARLIAFAKAEVPPPRTPPPLESTRKGIAQQTVGVGAIVGATTLSLAEIEKLETGDVIVLDHRSDANLDLTIDGSRAAEGAVAISSDQSRHSLVIERAVDQW